MRHEDALDKFFASLPDDTEARISEDIRISLEKNADRAKKEILDIFSSLCERGLSMQEAGLLGDVSVVCFSFLRVGLASEKGYCRTDIYDEDMLLQNAPCFALWDAKVVFGPYFSFVRELKTRAKAFGYTLREVDAEARALELSSLPQIAINAFLTELAPELGEHPAYASLSKTEDCVISAGEYRDSQTVIYSEISAPLSTPVPSEKKKTAKTRSDDMEYFLLSQNKRYSRTPSLMRLFYILDRGDICRERAHKLPSGAVVYVKEQDDYDLLDFFDTDLFLVSKDVEYVFSFYSGDIFFKDIVLVNEKRTFQKTYSIPILEDIRCLHADSEFGEYGFLKSPVLDRRKILGKSIFRISEAGQKTVVRLDVAESLFRRNPKGLVFTEIEAR
jgi:hypothetical protein